MIRIDAKIVEESAELKSVRARLGEIERELFAPGAYTNTQILAPLDEQGQRKHGAYLRSLLPPARRAFLAQIVAEQNVQAQSKHEAHFEALRKERESLLASLPPTGEASGQHLVMAGHSLRGTTIVRESVQED